MKKINMKKCSLLALAFAAFSSMDLRADSILASEAQLNINGELAVSAMNGTGLIRTGLQEILNDGNLEGNHSFFGALGSHVHQQAHEGHGYRDDLWGGLLATEKRCASIDSLLRVGLAGGYLRSDLDCFGPAILFNRNARQDLGTAGIFAAYDAVEANGLKSNINLFAGATFMRNKIYRGYEGGTYRANFCGLDCFAMAEMTKNLTDIGGWQIGPWLACDYHHLHQRQYSEEAEPNRAMRLKAVNYDVLNTIAGLNFERQFRNSANDDLGLKTFLRVGWHCQAIGKSHYRKGSALDHAITPDFVKPNFRFNDRHSTTAMVGFRNRLSRQWDLVANWQGFFSKNYVQNNASIGLGCKF